MLIIKEYDLPIGTIFEFEDSSESWNLSVEKYEGLTCKKCFFGHIETGGIECGVDRILTCESIYRKDQTQVIFMEVKE